MMMYIDRTAHDETEVRMENAVLATLEEVAAFQTETENRGGQWDSYVPAYAVVNGNLVFYANGSWEC